MPALRRVWQPRQLAVVQDGLCGDPVHPGGLAAAGVGRKQVLALGCLACLHQPCARQAELESEFVVLLTNPPNARFK